MKILLSFQRKESQISSIALGKNLMTGSSLARPFKNIILLTNQIVDGGKLISPTSLIDLFLYIS